MKIAAAVAVIGAVFAEWAGSSEGLGHVLITANGQLETARAFAATLLLFLLAIASTAPSRCSSGACRAWDAAITERRTMTRLPAVLLALLAAARRLRREGGADRRRPSATEPFTVMLDYFPNADHAGIYAAQAPGLYEKAGLRREDPAAAGPVGAAEAAAAGRADLAISYEPELLLARDQGADLVASARSCRRR